MNLKVRAYARARGDNKMINNIMTKKEFLDGIENFRNQLIARRDAEDKQFNENCNAFIQQLEVLGIVDIQELRDRQDKINKQRHDFYQKYLDALNKKEKETKEGELDEVFKLNKK